MQIQSSQNHQNTLRLVSPAASPDDCNPRSYNSDNISPLTNSVTLENKVELRALKEAENDSEIRIPGIAKRLYPLKKRDFELINAINLNE